jgi:hypothetical protein
MPSSSDSHIEVMIDDYNIAVKGVDVDIDVGKTVSPNLV